MSSSSRLVAARPVPVSEPAAATLQAPVTQGSLALQFQLAPDVPALPEVSTARMLQVIAGTGARAGLDVTETGLTDPRLPDVRAWSARLVQAVAEVVAGDRPIGQLIRWTDGAVYADLNRRVRLLGLTTTAGSRGCRERAFVHSVRVSAPAARVAEIAAHLRHGGRSRAVALRLEARRDRWVCTALQLG